MFSLFSCNDKLLVISKQIPNNKKDDFINNPFNFTIIKNYSDDFNSIGKVVSSSTSCPLLKENIADTSFCFIRTICYNGLLIRVFSFDVLQSGTAEYIVSNGNIELRNNLRVGSTKEEVVKVLGNPYKKKNNMWIWKSKNIHNYLVFTIDNDKVSNIRWHEEREPKYKNIIVWNTSY